MDRLSKSTRLSKTGWDCEEKEARARGVSCHGAIQPKGIHPLLNHHAGAGRLSQLLCWRGLVSLNLVQLLVI